VLVTSAGAWSPLSRTPERHCPDAPCADPDRPAVACRWRTGFAWSSAALLLIAVLGALKLAAPLHRDAATFLWMASQLDQGAVLYADVWDVKQPGVFLFAWLAGRLFGFTPEGLHLLELAWHLTFAVVAITALRPLLRHRWIAAVAPAAFLVPYYVFAEPHQQTQLEVLVALPLFASAWFTAVGWRSAGSRAAGFFAAGLAAGVATAFKHVLAPIPVIFLIAASVADFRRTDADGGLNLGRWRRLLLLAWLPFAAGVIVVWGGMALAFWWLGALDAFFATTFLYPLGALGAVSSAPVGRLAIAFAVFAVAMSPWLVYAGCGLWCQLRSGGPALFGRMGLWIATGIFVILLQKSSWWTYHTLLLYAPTAVLAARGLDLILDRLSLPAGDAGPANEAGANRIRSNRIGAGTRGAGQSVGASGLRPVMLSALLVLPLLAGFGYPAAETARALTTALTAEGGSLDSYRRQISADYARASEAAAFLATHAPAGPVYVFGDPTILLLDGRASALRIQGSAWGFFLPEQWRSLPTDLRAAAPGWVFVEEPTRLLIEEHSPETAALLRRDYQVAWDSPYGRWYERRSDADRLP